MLEDFFTAGCAALGLAFAVVGAVGEVDAGGFSGNEFRAATALLAY